MSATDFFDADDTGASAPAVNRNPMVNVMIDLETMGIRHDAPIVSIGAVTFDMQNLTLGERFYAVISLESSVDLGSVIDPATVMWWMGQSDDARKALLRKGEHVCDVLQSFSAWLDRNCVPLKSRRVWACGPDFDCVLLSEHFRKAGMDTPWMFWNQRCYRTLRELYPNVEPHERTGHHNALDDAVYQTEHIFNIRRTLRGNKG